MAANLMPSVTLLAPARAAIVPTPFAGRVYYEYTGVLAPAGPMTGHATGTCDLLIEIIAIDVVKFAGRRNSNQLHS